MNVFISWSGDRSRIIAEHLKKWIGIILQRYRPWISHDIKPGQQWFHALTEELEKAPIGIVCITRENLKEPWLLFEAGALMQSSKSKRVYTLLFDIEFDQVEQPLAGFQHLIANKDGIKRLAMTLNEELSSDKISEEALNDLFDKYWPAFELLLESVRSMPLKVPEPARTSEEMLAETLANTRELQSGIFEVVRHLVKIRSDLVFGVRSETPTHQPGRPTTADSSGPSRWTTAKPIGSLDYLKPLNPPS